MTFSMCMMFDAIASAVRQHSMGDISRECCIRGVLPYLPDLPITEDHIYIAAPENAEDFRGHANRFLIIYGLPQNSPLPELDCQYIVLHHEIHFGEALALALRAMEKYNHWYERLHSELSGVPDLNAICRIGNEQLGNPILLFAPNHEVAASADVSEVSERSFLESREGSVMMLSDDAYKALVNRPEFEDSIDVGMVSHMANPLGGNTLYINISCGQHEYRLCVNDTNRGFKPGDAQLCKILADILQAALEMDSSRENAAKADLSELFTNILEHRTVEPGVCETVLGAWNWRQDDRYLCLSIEKTNTSLQFVSNDKYICLKTEELLGDVCSFMLHGRLICLVHLNRELTPESIPEKLESFLRDNIFVVGISDIFDDVSKADHYYREACIALHFGRTEAPDMLFHSFRDYAFRSLMLHGLDGLPPSCYCDNNVRLLAAMQDSRVDYCETLRTYIENDRNLLRTAEQLHIHRTTLFYRLNKIREELSMDLDDPMTRLKIWISFILLDHENTEEQSF